MKVKAGPKGGAPHMLSVTTDNNPVTNGIRALLVEDWFHKGSTVEPNTGAHRHAKGTRPPYTNWSGARAASLMS